MVVGWASRWRRDVKLLADYTESATPTAIQMRSDMSALDFDRRLRAYF
jgi:hypothetical protein